MTRDPYSLYMLLNKHLPLHSDLDGNLIWSKLHDMADKYEIEMLCVNLALLGEVDTLEAIYASVGMVPIEYTRTDSRHYINGKILALGLYSIPSANSLSLSNNLLKQVETSEQMTRLLEIIPKVGMGFLTGVDCQHRLMFDLLSASKQPSRLFTPGYEGHLPVVDVERQTIEHPELLIALQERAAQSRYPEAFEPILCWVPETTVSRNPSAWRTYASRQELIISELPASAPHYERAVNLNSIKPGDLESLETTANTRYRGFRLHAASTAKNVIPLDEYLLQEMGSNEINYGFGFKKDHVLCRLQCSDIQSLSCSQTDSLERVKAVDFAKNYVPLGVMTCLYTREGGSKFIYPLQAIGINGSGMVNNTLGLKIKRVLKHIKNKTVIGKRIVKHIDADVLKFLITARAYHDKINDSILDKYDLDVAISDLGIKTDRLNGVLRFNNDDELSKSNVNFTSTTRIFLKDLNINTGRSVSTRTIKIELIPWIQEETLIILFDKGARIINGRDLTDVKTSLKEFAKAKTQTSQDTEMLHRARIKFEGLDNCLKAAKTSAHWSALADVFGREVMDRYLADAPKQHRGNVFSEDLGL